jgi:hypothetical protein
MEQVWPAVRGRHSPSAGEPDARVAIGEGTWTRGSHGSASDDNSGRNRSWRLHHRPGCRGLRCSGPVERWVVTISNVPVCVPQSAAHVLSSNLTKSGSVLGTARGRVGRIQSVRISRMVVMPRGEQPVGMQFQTPGQATVPAAWAMPRSRPRNSASPRIRPSSE